MISISSADRSDSGVKHHVAVAFGASFGGAFSIIIVVGLILLWRYRRNQQIFFDVNGELQKLLSFFRSAVPLFSV